MKQRLLLRCEARQEFTVESPGRGWGVAVKGRQTQKFPKQAGHARGPTEGSPSLKVCFTRGAWGGVGGSVG